MTLQELKNLTVTITYADSFKISEDMPEDILQEWLDDAESDEMSDSDLIASLIDEFKTNLDDVVLLDRFKVSII